jgi:uncharacterized glyoxalase superfamily protein PhnB
MPGSSSVGSLLLRLAPPAALWTEDGGQDCVSEDFPSRTPPFPPEIQAFPTRLEAASRPQTLPVQDKPNRAQALALKYTELEAFWMRTNLSMPTCAIIPVLEYPDVPAAVKWLVEAFAFQVRLRIGAHRAQLQFGGGAVVVSESNSPGAVPGSVHSVMVRVEAIDAHLLRARQHGARIIRDLEDFPYGERQYTCLDLADHRWTFSETIANVAPADWGGELAASPPI